MAATQPSPLEWHPRYAEHVVIELTDDCNLRCVYCHQNLPNFKGRGPMAAPALDALVGHLRQHGIAAIDVTGGGDLTMAPDWVGTCQRLLDAGGSLGATLNLGRLLSDAEIDVLSRFRVLTISLDTLDRQLLRRYRKSVDVRTVLTNMGRIKARALLHRGPQPVWILSAVLYAETAQTLPELAAFAVTFGCTRFVLQDLVVLAPIRDNVQSIWTLTGATATDTARHIKHALSIVRAANIPVIAPGDFDQKIDRLETNTLIVRANTATDETGRHSHTTFDAGIPAGMTRDCTDPWTFLQVLSDGIVRPCCLSRVQLGRLGDDGDLDAIMNDEKAQQLRSRLLTGALDGNCAACTARSLIAADAYRDKMAKLLAARATA